MRIILFPSACRHFFLEHPFHLFYNETKSNGKDLEIIMKKESPSLDLWLKEAKADPNAEKCGMYLTHNGIVRKTAKARVRFQEETAMDVKGMLFSYDDALVRKAVSEARELPGIYYVRVWLNEGELHLGDDIMFVLIGGDIRPHVVDALQALVGNIKSNCVTEQEIYE